MVADFDEQAAEQVIPPDPRQACLSSRLYGFFGATRIVARAGEFQRSTASFESLGRMKKYKVFVCGQNFLLNLDGKVGKVGFYTTRFVEAQNDHEAEENAISTLRNDPTLRDGVLNEKSDAPMLFVEEIAELDSFDGLTLPGTGFSFYTGDEAE